MPSPAFAAPPLAAYTPVNASALAKRTTLALIGIAVVIALVGGAGFFVINGQIQQELTIQANRDSQVGSAKEIAGRAAKATSDFNAVNSQLKYIEQPTDIKSYVPTLLPQIESLAKSYNLQVTAITPGVITTVGPSASSGSASPSAPASATDSLSDSATSAAPVASYQTMPLSINLSGSYRQVMKYIYSLTRFPKVVSVKEISLHPASSGAGAAGATTETTVGASLQLVAYVFQPTPGLSTDSAAPTSTAPVAAVAPATSVTAPAAITSPVPRPMHGLLSPLANQPLPTPSSLKILGAARPAQTSGSVAFKSNK